MKKKVMITIDESLHNEAQKACKDEMRSFSGLICWLLQKHIKEN